MFFGNGIFGYFGTSVGSGSSAQQKQTFVATAGQTTFTVTEMTLNDEVTVFLEGALQSESMYNRSGNDITFVIPLKEGMEVVIVN